MNPQDPKEEVYENSVALESDYNFRSAQSDIEIPKTRKRKAEGEDGDKGGSTATLSLDPLAMTKENMSTSRRPADSAFTQQRLFGWQPILTPYNVLPVLFILGLIFIPIGVVFLTASMGIQEYVIDYSKCAGTSAGATLTKVDDGCEIVFNVAKEMKSPVAVYYRLTNFYQNNRLYAKSRSDAQLRGEALTAGALADCDPLVNDLEGRVYYPCGLVANSYFTDTFTISKKDSVEQIEISAQNIAWPGDEKLYGKSAYSDASKIAFPPSWKDRTDINIDKENGVYNELPDLSKDQRFQNWMKISGLPTFRKLYGRIERGLEKGTYVVKVKGDYEVSNYQGTKSFVISTTNWAGGKNDSLGIGFISVGAVLLVLGLVFLVMFMMAPRKVGDVSYLSWYSKNSGDPLATELNENGEEIRFEESQ